MRVLLLWLCLPVLLLLVELPSNVVGFCCPPTRQPTQFTALSQMSSSSKVRLFATRTIWAPPLLSTETKEEASPPLEIVYTTDTHTLKEWLEQHATKPDQISPDNPIILGFDTETIPRANFLSYGRRPHNEKEGPATLQLATLDSCLIVHLTHCQQTNLEPLQRILEDRSILKAGVAIDDDALEVYRSSFNFQVTSRLDIGCALTRSTTKPGQRLGLRALLAEASQLDLPKSKKISMSNWGAKKLTEAQLVYAARDAWAAVRVVHSLQNDHHNGAALVPVFLETEERPLVDMDVRARKRKEAKMAFTKLKEQTEPLTQEQKEEQTRLWRIRDNMRPDQPIHFNVTIHPRSSVVG